MATRKKTDNPEVTDKDATEEVKAKEGKAEANEPEAEKPEVKEPEASEPEVSEAEASASEDSEAESSAFPEVNNFNMALITAFGLALLVIIVMLASGTSPEQVAAVDEAMDEVVNAPETSQTIPGPRAAPPAASTASTASPAASTPAAASPTATQTGDVVGDGVIERKGEGRHFYTTIKIPPGAETLYLSGSGASRQADGTWGDMEQQTIDTFNSFKETLEAEGWSMADIVQVRAFAVAGEFGLLDFDGFNRAYRQFFGTEENPMKPVRSFVQIAGLVVPGWLVEIEIRAARMPQD